MAQRSLLLNLATLQRRLASSSSSAAAHRLRHRSAATLQPPLPPPPRFDDDDDDDGTSIAANNNNDEELRELLVRPSTRGEAGGGVVGVRAYHCGGRLQIATLAALSRARGYRCLHQGGGAEFCLVWLHDGREPEPGPAAAGDDDAQSRGGRGIVGVDNAGQGARDDLSAAPRGAAPTSAAAGGPFLLAAYAHGGVALFGGSRRHDEQLLQEWPLHASVVSAGASGGGGGVGGGAAGAGAGGGGDPDQQQQQQEEQQQQQHPSPPAATTARISEEYALHLDPRSPRFAQRLPDALLLRRLDVGAARVVSSILAQSVSLDHYRRAVDANLDAFTRAKARAAAAGGGGSAGGGGQQQHKQQQPQRPLWRSLLRAVLPRGALPGRVDDLLARATASGALAAIEARALLDDHRAGTGRAAGVSASAAAPNDRPQQHAPHPAWQRDDYHDLQRALMAEFELERRLAALERVINRQEEEAQFDLGLRHERRYHQLERAVIALLGVSCAIKLVELGVEVA
jgi:hypothetical protein